MNDFKLIVILLLFVNLTFTVSIYHKVNAADREYFYTEMGFGRSKNLTGCSMCWEDQNQMSTLLSLGYRWESDGKYLDIHLMHLSHLLVGPPIDARPESSVDHLGFKVGIMW